LTTLLIECRREDAFRFASIAQAKSFCKNPSFGFSFDPSAADDGNKSLRVKLVGEAPATTDISTTIVKRVRKDVYVNVRVMFVVSVKDNTSQDEFDNWAEYQGGSYCVLIEPHDIDWGVPEDFAGEIYLGTKNEYGMPLSELYPGLEGT